MLKQHFLHIAGVRGRLHAAFCSVTWFLGIVWGFIESDFLTFAVPNTIFGLISALASVLLVDGPRTQPIDVLQRAPCVLLFNTYSLLIFDLANQRSPESVEEDKINKPWRPIPSKHISSEHARIVLLFVAAASLGCNYILGVWSQGLLVQVLSYYYNELKGGDGLLRDIIIAISYGLANRTSLQLAIGPQNSINVNGNLWIVLVSLVIMTTMHIQDLKDQEGDRKLGRRTMPLVFGDGLCRIALALFIPFWSVVAAQFWQLGTMLSMIPCGLGVFVSTKVLTQRRQDDDARTWRTWCLWHASLYFLPFLAHV